MWREGYVAAGDTRFFVRALGHGDDLAVLLHGWPEDGSSWRSVAPLLVDAGYRVVAPDLKGFGRSEAPSSGYDPATLADEISQLIRNLHVEARRPGRATTGAARSRSPPRSGTPAGSGRW